MASSCLHKVAANSSRGFHALWNVLWCALSAALLSCFFIMLSPGPALGDVTARIQGTIKGEVADRRIIDLRGNIGGGLGLARLASYLCPGQLPIGHSLTRRRLRTGYDVDHLPRVPMPQSTAELLWTLSRFSLRDKSVTLLTQGLGPQPFHNKIVLLVNEWTNSAAEMVAGFAQAHRLATIVGNKTAGNVLGAANFKLGAGYTLRLPIFGWYTPRGDCLEGKGVLPDVRLEVDPYLLNAGIDQQMHKALGILRGTDRIGNAW